MTGTTEAWMVDSKGNRITTPTKTTSRIGLAAVFGGAFLGAAVFGSAASGAPFLDVATSVSGAVGAAVGYTAGRLVGGEGWSKDVAPIALSFLVPGLVGGRFDGVTATIAVGACVGGFGAESYFK